MCLIEASVRIKTHLHIYTHKFTVTLRKQMYLIICLTNTEYYSAPEYIRLKGATSNKTNIGLNIPYALCKWKLIRERVRCGVISGPLSIEMLRNFFLLLLLELDRTSYHSLVPRWILIWVIKPIYARVKYVHRLCLLWDWWGALN